MVSAPGCFIDWSQLASELDFEVISRMHSPLLESEPCPTSSFAELLAPLTRTTHQEVIHQIEVQLQVVNQTLAMLEGQTFEVILQSMLHTFAGKVGEILNADRTSIFLVDASRQELWSIVTETEQGTPGFEIRLPWQQGIVGEVAHTHVPVNVPFDFYDDPRSAAAKKLEAQTGYRTYTLLALPVLDRKGNILAVVELLNKRLPQLIGDRPLIHRIDLDGFRAEDEATFQAFVEVFRLILESSQAFYQAARRQRSATLLIKATQALNYSGASLTETLARVNQEARYLVEADRSIVWLMDSDRGELWIRVPSSKGQKELRVSVGEGCVGQVAETGMILNLTCDAQGHLQQALTFPLPEADYHAYSLLCMPMFDTAGTLIAVTQLLNKYRSGMKKHAFVPDPPANTIPACFQTRFNDDDEFFLLAFNIHAGAAIKRALRYESLQNRLTQLEQENQYLRQGQSPLE